jgi:hypothetical protein
MSLQRIILGSFEPVSLPEFGLEQVVAKIDTGAFSGAIHCTDIKVVRRGLLRKQILKFVPAGRSELAKETEKFIKKHVRSATGHRVKRYLVQTNIEIKGQAYPIEIGLSDRSDMKRQVLLGRRFLRENNMLVDVNQNVQYDDEGELTQ